MPPPHSHHLRCLLLMMIVPLVSLAPPSPTVLMPPHCKDKEMTCFVYAKCISPLLGEKLTEMVDDTQTCDVHVEIRSYNDKKALIRLKTKQGSIKLSQDSKPLFGCETKGGKIQAIEPTKMLNFVSEKWENGISCEFLFVMDSPLEKAKDIEVEYGGTKFSAAKDIQNYILDQTNYKCDLDKLESVTDEENSIFAEPDKRFNNVVCREGDGELVYEDDKQSSQLSKSVECKKEGTAWQYEITDKDGNIITDTTKVSCRSKACRKCTTIPDLPQPCADCAVPTLDTSGECNALKCDGKISINNLDTAAVVIGSPECVAHEEADKTTYRWLLNGKAVTKAACTATVKCQEMNPLELESDGVKLDLTKNTLKCDKEEQIKWTEKTSDGEDGAHLTEKILCDVKSGLWTTLEGGNVTAGAKLSCSVKEAKTEPATGSALGTPETIAIAMVGVVIVAVIIMLIFCFIYKPKKRAAAAKKKAKTLTDSRQEDDTKTALPLGYRPPVSNTNSDQPTPIKVEIAADLVEKTGISRTPEPAPIKGVVMDTAHLPATTPSEDQAGSKEVRAIGHSEDQKDGKHVSKHRSQSDGSEPRSLKIGQDGNVIIPEKKKKKKTGEDKSSQSEAAGATRKEEKPAKPVDTGPKPRVFPLDPKEEKIRRGATVKNTDYPTLAEIDSDWDDYDHAKALAAGNAEAGKKPKKGNTGDKTKTVPTAVTPEVPPSVERTQATNTRHTQDGGAADMENLVTQLDTTVEQKEADGKKK